MADLLSVEEALKRTLAGVTEPTASERVPVVDAIGRTLAEDLRALRTQPPFANSAMDGYAFAASQAGARFRVVGESAAGRAFSGVVRPGEAVRIFTGAPMPEGADGVLMQEDAERAGENLLARVAVARGENVRAGGIDFKEGAAILHAGERLTPRGAALAAAANHASVAVRRRPRVAILATGDELVPPGAPIGPSQIVASNNIVVKGVVEAAGGEALDLGIAPDDREKLSAAMDAALGADVLVTLGGASVGDYDLVQDVLKGRGMALDFWRIAMRPGKPLMVGRLGPLHVLGLPGNPASSFVCSVLFLRPLVRALLGDPAAGADPTEPARLGEAQPANGVRADYIRARLAPAAEDLPLAAPAGGQDSSLVGVMARADALIVRPPFAPAARAGDPCRIIRLAALGA